jgi:hypothetical protein
MRTAIAAKKRKPIVHEQRILAFFVFAILSVFLFTQFAAD